MKSELVAPAGDWTMLRAGVNAGADAVYFGLKELNMRMAANNFLISDLKKITSFCHKNNVKTHLALNSIIFNDDLKKLDRVLAAAKKSKIDMIICWDMAAVEKVIKMDMNVCLSTQASVSNSESAKFFKRIGVKRIVPARECSLEQIKQIKKTGIELEVFVHGAMCVSISGRCFLSHYLYGKSANRGECMQPCRYEYNVIDKEKNKELILGNNYVMSPKDLCTIMFIDQLIDNGIDAFKIEGRKRSPEYVRVVTECYKQAIELHKNDILTDDAKLKLLEKLKSVFNREFSTGFYLKPPNEDDFTNTGGSSATTRKVYIGKVVNVKKKTVLIKIESECLKKGDTISIQGPDTGVMIQKIDEIHVNNKLVKIASKSEIAYIYLDSIVNKNDKVYLIRSVDAPSGN